MNIAFIVSTPITAKAFLVGHMRELLKFNEVTLIANFTHKDKEYFTNNMPSLKLIDVGIPRKISLISDFLSLIKMIVILKTQKFDLVHSVTPKAGLIGSIAGKILGVNYRIHTFTGQVWCNEKGIYRLLLKFMDRLTARCVTHVLVDSSSQRDFLVDEGVVSIPQSRVLGSGSISGVDIARFSFDQRSRSSIRNSLGLSDDHFVYLFLGRINRDKGILELLEAFSMVKQRNPRKDISLLAVGPDEDNLIKNQNICDVIYVDYTDNPEQYFSVADVFCLPSHREGFGSVIIEAAAAKVPSIGSDIYGICDAIVDGYSGLLHNCMDSLDLALKMETLLLDVRLKGVLGGNARKRALSEFTSEKSTNDLVNFYTEITNAKALL